ncbi:t-SNARE affecting a late Golgi compartment protein 2 [Smittium culicis]|uniref:t-SNARE affecting a late Golgi compartment protein 2 n=1 Tax=Smittium culicis TaxID=133412 RepID=A0A1R1Y1V7_9FUNG|nr:t-SNARE affecting a late Golgi compartment protein 2 [Smittium culicis]
MHKKHMLPGFSDRTKEEVEIYNLTQEITKKFNLCQTAIRQLTINALNGQEAQLATNIQSSLALELQTVSTKYRKSQTRYLQQVTNIKSASKDVFAIDFEEQKRNDIKYDFDLSDTQIGDIELLDKAISSRDEEISNISKSIFDLNLVFKDLHSMVINQGTVLDRIDYNVENTVVHVEAAKNELETAHETQKNSNERKIMLFLLCVFLFLFGILVIKHL